MCVFQFLTNSNLFRFRLFPRQSTSLFHFDTMEMLFSAASQNFHCKEDQQTAVAIASFYFIFFLPFFCTFFVAMIFDDITNKNNTNTSITFFKCDEIEIEMQGERHFPRLFYSSIQNTFDTKHIRKKKYQMNCHYFSVWFLLLQQLVVLIYFALCMGFCDSFHFFLVLFGCFSRNSIVVILKLPVLETNCTSRVESTKEILFVGKLIDLSSTAFFFYTNIHTQFYSADGNK